MTSSARGFGRRFHASLAALITVAVGLTGANVAQAKPLKLEKEQLKIGFIKLTDMGPRAIAYEKGFFEDEGHRALRHA